MLCGTIPCTVAVALRSLAYQVDAVGSFDERCRILHRDSSVEFPSIRGRRHGFCCFSVCSFHLIVVFLEVLYIRISYAFSTERAGAMRAPAVWLLGGTGLLWVYHNSIIICGRSEARLRALYSIVSLSLLC
eukprot:73996-Pyramimonas_sp.AAC.1